MWFLLANNKRRDRDARMRQEKNLEISRKSSSSPASSSSSSDEKSIVPSQDNHHQQPDLTEELRVLRNQVKLLSGLPRIRDSISSCHEKGGWMALGVLEGAEVACNKMNDSIDSVNLYSALFLSVTTGLLYNPNQAVLDKGGATMQG
jgi:hypothetical protein